MPKHKEERIRSYSKGTKDLKKMSLKRLKDLLLAREKDYQYYRQRIIKESSKPLVSNYSFLPWYKNMVEQCEDRLLQIRAEMERRRVG